MGAGATEGAGALAAGGGAGEEGRSQAPSPTHNKTTPNEGALEKATLRLIFPINALRSG